MKILPTPHFSNGIIWGLLLCLTILMLIPINTIYVFMFFAGLFIMPLSLKIVGSIENNYKMKEWSNFFWGFSLSGSIMSAVEMFAFAFLFAWYFLPR